MIMGNDTVPVAAQSVRHVSDGGRNRMAGFTLIELMIVVAVIAILAAIAYPSYQEHVRKSRRAQAQADLVEYAQVAERYHSVNNTYTAWVPPNNQSPRTGTAHYTIGATVAAGSFSITATPQGAQANDRCGVLATDNVGRKWHSTGTNDECAFGGTGSPPAQPAEPEDP